MARCSLGPEDALLLVHIYTKDVVYLAVVSCRVVSERQRNNRRGNEEKRICRRKQLSNAGSQATRSDPSYPPVSHGKRAPGTSQLRQRDGQVGGGKLGVKARQVLESS